MFNFDDCVKINNLIQSRIQNLVITVDKLKTIVENIKDIGCPIYKLDEITTFDIFMGPEGIFEEFITSISPYETLSHPIYQIMRLIEMVYSSKR